MVDRHIDASDAVGNIISKEFDPRVMPEVRMNYAPLNDSERNVTQTARNLNDGK